MSNLLFNGTLKGWTQLSPLDSSSGVLKQGVLSSNPENFKMWPLGVVTFGWICGLWAL